MTTETDVGCEWVVDAHGCNARQLRDLDMLRDVCQRVIDDLQLNVVGQPHWHQFPGHAGVTGLYLLSESHLACHTYPERQLATFNLYCCRTRCAWDWREQLREALEAEFVTVVEIVRGQPLEQSQQHQQQQRQQHQHQHQPQQQQQTMYQPSTSPVHWTGKEPV